MGLHLGRDRYLEFYEEDHPHRFEVRSLAVDRSRGNLAKQIVLKSFEWPDAAKIHMRTIPKLIAWGFVDICSALEDFVFEMFEIFLRGNPESLIQDPEHLGLRILWEQRSEPGSRQAFLDAFGPRLRAWREKKSFTRLDRLFLDLLTRAGLEKPSGFASGPEDWAAALRLFSLIRNSVVHGIAKYPKNWSSRALSPSMQVSGSRRNNPWSLN